MSISAEAVNGVRWYLYLAPPPTQEAIGFNYLALQLRSMVMVHALERFTPPIPRSVPLAGTAEAGDIQHLGGGYRFAGEVEDLNRAVLSVGMPERWTPPQSRSFTELDLWPEDRQHLAGGHRFDPSQSDGTVPDPPEPDERVLTSSRFPPRYAAGWYDAPIMFSSDGTTSWRFIVSNAGVFSTISAPLQVAQFEYIPFYNDYLQAEQILTVDNSGNFAISALGQAQILIPTVLARGGVIYIPDGRFPAPVGSSQGSLLPF